MDYELTPFLLILIFTNHTTKTGYFATISGLLQGGMLAEYCLLLYKYNLTLETPVACTSTFQEVFQVNM
jgi:hypothetical protein